MFMYLDDYVREYEREKVDMRENWGNGYPKGSPLRYNCCLQLFWAEITRLRTVLAVKT